MALEEDPDLIGRSSPNRGYFEVVRNLSGRNFVRQPRDCRENPAGVLANVRKETMGKQHGHDDNCEIGFQNMGPLKFLKTESAAARIGQSG